MKIQKKLFSMIFIASVVGATWIYTSDGSSLAPPICEACGGPGFLECWEGLNWGFEDCQTVWRGGVQICEEAGTTQSCEGL